MTIINSLKLSRQSGNVRRCHLMPWIGEYTTGKHSFDVAMVLIHLHPDPSRNLLCRALLHDRAERWTGDIPAQAKWNYEALGIADSMIDKEINEVFNAKFPLTVEEHVWLKAADMLELKLSALDQMLMGNRNAESVFHNVKNWFHTGPLDIPETIKHLGVMEYEEMVDLFMRTTEDDHYQHGD